MPKKDNAPKPETEKAEETAAPERPSWLPEGYDAPEKFAEEAQSWRERAQKAEEFEKKFGTIDTFPERITAAEAKLREAVRAEYEAKLQQPQTKQTNTDDAFADWETLPATEQARRMKAMLVNELQGHLDESVKGYWTQAQSEIGKGLKTSQDQMNLLIRGYDISRQTGVPVEKIWPVLEELATAPTDRLMNLAVQQLQGPTQQEQKIKEAVAAERAKWDTEAKNREQANLAATRPASYRELHKGPERGPDGRITKQSIRDAVFQKYANGEIPRG